MQDWENLNFPPQQHCHSKEEFVKTLNNKMLQTKIRFRSPRANNHNESALNAESQENDEEPSVRGKTLLNKKPVETNAAFSDSTDAIIPSTPAAVKSKLLAMGTPVSIRYSPYNSLPNLDKFATNMGDLELFENLPNSTGAFQKLKSLLNKVRNAFNK